MRAGKYPMFVGAYWIGRQETRAQSAERVANFLAALERLQGDLFGKWYAKTKRAATRFSAPLSRDDIPLVLKENRRDVDNSVMPELGFSLGIWNGKSVSLSGTIGATNPHVRNSVVLSFGDGTADLAKQDWKAILSAEIDSFEPDCAVVTSVKHLAEIGKTDPCSSGMFVYGRDQGLREGVFCPKG